VILLDTSGLLAAIDASQRSHEAARRALENAEGPLVLSPLVLAELDYLLATRIGVAAKLALLDEVAAGAYELAPFDARDVAEARTLIDSYRDLELGLADASIAALAGRLDTDAVLTLDERHFRAIRGPGGRRFRLLPADA
jgi:predicted nucleic acid-binding protein